MTAKVSPILDPLSLPHITLPNRVVRSATATGMADENGYVTPRLEALYRPLAEGGIGLIITGHCYIAPQGMASAGQTGIHEDGCIPGLSRVTAQKEGTGVKIIAQISHAGAKAPLTPQPVGPSAVCLRRDGVAARPLERGEMEGIRDQFVQAALRAQKAGFDGVQVHCAHGYLLSQFLDPFYNTREDGYGRTAEGRFRLAGEVIEGVKAACGADFPVFVKINATTAGDDEAYGKEMAAYLNLLLECGVESAELSGHIVRKRGKTDRLYFFQRAAALREKTPLPLMLVGGIRSLEEMERVLAAGIQQVSLCRPFISEPDLIPRLLAGKPEAACVGCEQCFTKTDDGGVRLCALHRAR